MSAVADVQESRALFILGLPYVADGPLLRKARELGAPVLLSANAFSVWARRDGWREWTRFRKAPLQLLEGMDAYLDSAGFVAASRYGGFEWSVDAYLDLCEAFPWTWFAAMDYCVEPQIAPDRTAVLDRLAMTTASLKACLSGARERGIDRRLLPVVQGWKPDDYARCLERISFAIDRPVIGVGSVCRRNLGGPDGIFAVVDRLHDELGSAPTKLHLFGVKSEAVAALAGHPRIASFDSQAYGIRARHMAFEGGFSKTNVFLAEVMGEWFGQQCSATYKLKRPPTRQSALAFPESAPQDAFEQRLERARNELRELVEAGELDATWLNDLRALDWLADD